MKMRKTRRPVILMLVAGLITGVSCIATQKSILSSLECLLTVLVLFYCIGIIAEKILQKVLQGKSEKKQGIKPSVASEKAEM